MTNEFIFHLGHGSVSDLVILDDKGDCKLTINHNGTISNLRMTRNQIAQIGRAMILLGEVKE